MGYLSVPIVHKLIIIELPRLNKRYRGRTWRCCEMQHREYHKTYQDRPYVNVRKVQFVKFLYLKSMRVTQQQAERGMQLAHLYSVALVQNEIKHRIQFTLKEIIHAVYESNTIALAKIEASPIVNVLCIFVNSRWWVIVNKRIDIPRTEILKSK